METWTYNGVEYKEAMTVPTIGVSMIDVNVVPEPLDVLTDGTTDFKVRAVDEFNRPVDNYKIDVTDYDDEKIELDGSEITTNGDGIGTLGLTAYLPGAAAIILQHGPATTNPTTGETTRPTVIAWPNVILPQLQAPETLGIYAGQTTKVTVQLSSPIANQDLGNRSIKARQTQIEPLIEVSPTNGATDGNGKVILTVTGRGRQFLGGLQDAIEIDYQNARGQSLIKKTINVTIKVPNFEFLRNGNPIGPMKLSLVPQGAAVTFQGLVTDDQGQPLEGIIIECEPWPGTTIGPETPIAMGGVSNAQGIVKFTVQAAPAPFPLTRVRFNVTAGFGGPGVGILDVESIEPQQPEG